MKTFAWAQALAKHGVFSALDDKQRARLLDDDVSEERNFRSEEIILKEGGPGDAVFVIGSGSAAVTLLAPDGKPVSVARLGPGELFGEMAVLEQRNRAANVVAAEPCIVLEIKGSAFLRVLRENPNIEFRVLLLLSQRLREVGEHVLSIRLMNVDEKLRMFDNKLNAELKAIDASLRAAQTVFDQTSTRANEVIESAGRSRTRITAAASTIGGIITIVLSMLAVFGYSEVKDLQEYREAAEKTLLEAKNTADEAQKYTNTIKEYARGVSVRIENIKDAVKNVNELQENIKTLRNSEKKSRKIFYLNVVTSSFPGYFSTDPETAAITFQEIIRINDNTLTERLFKVINREISGSKIERFNSMNFLLEHAVNVRFGENDYAKLLSYYLLLMAQVLDMAQTTSDGDVERSMQYTLTIREFSRYLRDLNVSYKSKIEDKFDPEIFKIKIDSIAFSEAITSEAVTDEKIRRLKDLVDEVWRKIS